MKSDPSYDDLLKEIAELRRQIGTTDNSTAMSEMAMELIHELNQPLVAIHNFAQAIQHAASQGERAKLDFIKQCSESIDSVASEASEAIGRLRSCATRRVLRLAPMQINDVILKSLDLFNLELENLPVSLDLDLAPDVPTVQADSARIEQVVVNLLKNALEAVSERDAGGGQITVRTTQLENGLQVTVSDNGPGIAPEFLNKLFQPFQTSKVGGLGIGLAICRSIVNSHRGRIWHEPVEPHGACFQFTLPMHRDLDE